MSSEIANYFVEGVPHPQGSKSGFLVGKRVVIVEGKGKGMQLHKAWRAAISDKTEEYMAENGLEEFEGVVRVELTFYMPKPKSRHKKVRLVSVRPDVDKLMRAVLDGISSLKETTGIITDDSHVAQLYAEKIYAKPDEKTGVHIRVIDIESERLYPE